MGHLLLEDQMVELKNLIVEHLTIFRFLLLLCSCCYAVLIYYWMRPNRDQLQAAAMAITVQFWIGLLLDGLLVDFGFWKYRAMGFTTWEVPIDLHLDWSILWGTGICWLFDKWPGRDATWRQFFIYIAFWTLLTLAFDMMMADWMVFLDKYSLHWWWVDISLLMVIQGVTVWFYCSLGDGLNFLPKIPPYIRSIVYLSFFIWVFFIYIPEQINVLVRYFGIVATTYHFTEMAYIVLFVSIVIGGHATYEFACKGEGTPIPLDGPKFLVTSGPYLFMANPMQLSGILLTTAILLFNFNWINLIYLIDVVLVVWLIFEHLESIQLKKAYGSYFSQYLNSVPLWKINLIPQKLHENFRPTLFIDTECRICVQLSRQLEKIDLSKNIKMRSLSNISRKEHGHLKALADSNTTIIFAEPRVRKNGPIEFYYSQKGRAVLRIFGYLPMPFCLIAFYEGIPTVPLFTDFLYTLFAKNRKCPGK